MIRVTRKKTGHLIEVTRDDGTKDVSWDWAQLEADVKAAIANYEDQHVHVEETPKKPVTKKAPTKKPATKKQSTKKKETK